MRTVVYLALTETGSVRAMKSQPRMKAGEVAVRLVVTVPDSAFRSPLATAHVEVPEGNLIYPTADVAVLPPPDDEPEENDDE